MFRPCLICLWEQDGGPSPVGPMGWLRLSGLVSVWFWIRLGAVGRPTMERIMERFVALTQQPAMHGGRDGWMDGAGVMFIRDHGLVCGSRRSDLTNYLGENPGGNLGTAQANPCCWLTPIGP